jgi:orotidine-5'-phosphate decarboxylase
MVELLDPARCRLKIGKELFTRAGPGLVRRVIDAGFDVFLDLKYHDIPNTVAGACSAAADLGCWMINLHASGGRAMMEAACERLAHHAARPLLVAVTVLTSMDETAVGEVGFTTDPHGLVLRLAGLAQECGMDGVVCSAHEIRSIKQRCGNDFMAVTPGVRPKDSAADDQLRVATPAVAVGAGADFLVIGRPITRAEDPAAALDAIYAEVSGSCAGG